MAHVIKLKYGSPASWAYVDLTDINHGIVDYVPTPGSEGVDDLVESGVFRVVGSSVADLESKIRAIETIFHQAAAYEASPVGAYQVRLTVQLSGSAETWESPIYEGRLMLPNQMLGPTWANREGEVTLTWRRAAWFERYVSVPVTNPNGAAQTDGLVVYACNDGETADTIYERWNYADIAAGAVPGDMPAPAVIALVGMDAPDYAGLTDVYVGGNAKTAPATLVYQIEGETGTGDTVDADRSAGKFHRYALSAGTLTPIEYDASTALGAVLTGAWLRVILSANFDGVVKVRPYISINTIKYYGPATTNIIGTGDSFELYDLGLLQLPMIGIYDDAVLSGYRTTEFKIGFTAINAAGLNFDLDYMQFSPVDTALHGVFENAIANTGADKQILIDCHDGNIRFLVKSGASWYMGAAGVLYGGIYLEPGIAQRLVFNWMCSVATYPTDLVSSGADVVVHCWARRRTM